MCALYASEKKLIDLLGKHMYETETTGKATHEIQSI